MNVGCPEKIAAFGSFYIELLEAAIFVFVRLQQSPAVPLTCHRPHD
jgi:hypothetical protein